MPRWRRVRGLHLRLVGWVLSARWRRVRGRTRSNAQVCGAAEHWPPNTPRSLRRSEGHTSRVHAAGASRQTSRHSQQQVADIHAAGVVEVGAHEVALEAPRALLLPTVRPCPAAAVSSESGRTRRRASPVVPPSSPAPHAVKERRCARAHRAHTQRPGPGAEGGASRSRDAPVGRQLGASNLDSARPAERLGGWDVQIQADELRGLARAGSWQQLLGGRAPARSERPCERHQPVL